MKNAKTLKTQYMDNKEEEIRGKQKHISSISHLIIYAFDGYKGFP